MKNVLIVAYYFPPSGGPGVQRVLKYVQYLRAYGWRPTVLTVKDANFPARDESLLKAIPSDVEVVRTEIFEPYDIYRKLTGKSAGTAIDVNTIHKAGAKLPLREKLAEFVRSTLFIPDARIGWYSKAVKAGMEIIDRKSIDVIYSSSPPYTCALIARALKRKSDLPWIAGFRDPWTKFITTPNRWFLPAAIDRKMEHSVFKEANAVEVAWLGIMKDALQKYPELDQSKFHHLPNGYDSNDFPVLREDELARSDDRFTVVYTGSMYGRRNPDAFLNAVEILVRKGDVDASKILLKFIGRFSDEVHQQFTSSDIAKSIEVVGYMPHHDSVVELTKADAVLLVVDECAESEEVVPGKVYEYIGSHKPVLAVAPERSAIADLFNETHAGLVAHQSNTAGIANAFLKLYNDHFADKSTLEPDVTAIEQYDRRIITGRLAQLFESVTSDATKTQ